MALPLSDPGPGHGAAIRADRTVPVDAERRAAGDLELLAGRRRRRRRAELRHHRQAAVCVARRPGARPRASTRSPRDGGDAFADYQVPLAILALQQGLGRLIRHRTDRGVLAVLDPRLRTMGYGRRFLASLPPAPVTHDLDAVERSSCKLLRQNSVALTFLLSEGFHADPSDPRQCWRSCVVLAVSAPAAAQSIIRGKVVDAQGKPVEGAAVTIEATESNRKAEIKDEPQWRVPADWSPVRAVQRHRDEGQPQAGADRHVSQGMPVELSFPAVAERAG